jgi:type II secretory pathway pseudopilin PulG
VLRAPRSHRRDDAGAGGFTVVEVVIASAILMTVLAMLFSTLVSLMRSEDHAQRLVSNEQVVRFELNQLAREVRSANPLVILPNPTDYSNTVALLLGPSDGTQEVVRWTYELDPSSPNYLRLSRQLLSDASESATVLSESWFLTRVRNAELGKPIFTFYDSLGNNMVEAGFSSADIQNCAIRVRIELTADSNPGPLPFTETQDVELRNRLPGGVGCLPK